MKPIYKKLIEIIIKILIEVLRGVFKCLAKIR